MVRVPGCLIGMATVVLLIFAQPGRVMACSCQSSGPPCQSVSSADVVFAGTVLSVAPLPDDAPPPQPGMVRMPPGYRVEFSEVASFRGSAGPRLILTTSHPGGCGYTFAPGARYLVYATRGADGGLVTSICSRTRPVAEAAEDLKFLQLPPVRPGEPARVYGTITHWERELSSGDPKQYGPVRDVLVHVRGAANSFDVLTDASGHYEVMVPPGQYDIAAFPPAGFSTRYLQRTLQLRESRACFVQDFSLQYDGRVAGVIRGPSGGPLARAAVQLMAADDVGKTGNIRTERASSDASGRFEFTEVSPGRYVVGVDLTRRMDAEVVFPPTFYPGTPDASQATVIELNGGGRRDLGSIALPSARHPFRLTGIVVFEDGRPATEAFVSLQDGDANWRQVAAGIKPAADGSFSFVVHEGLGYTARASYWDSALQAGMGGAVGPFVVTTDTAPLRLVLRPGRGEH